MTLGQRDEDENRGGSYLAVKQALCWRIARGGRIDLVSKYGIEMVMDAVNEKAEGFESYQLEEIGTSDVSCWIKDIEETLKRWKEREAQSKVVL